jgi:lysosomal alpha-mannosidase
MGDDFRYMNAMQNFENMDAMISYMNENYGDKFNMFYSTPSIYVDALASHNATFPTKYDDMMPYADHPDAYWTGYFSSRANDKEVIRRGSHNLDASHQLYARDVINQEFSSDDIQKIMESRYNTLDALGIN